MFQNISVINDRIVGMFAMSYGLCLCLCEFPMDLQVQGFMRKLVPAMRTLREKIRDLSCLVGAGARSQQVWFTMIPVSQD